MEICAALSDSQKVGALRLVGKILDRTVTRTPETIIRNVYDSVYDSFVKNNMANEAVSNALGMAQYAAQNLHLMLQRDPGQPIRQTIEKVLGNPEAFTIENINRLTKVEEIKKLVGLKEQLPTRVPFTVDQAAVSAHLDSIKQAFPQPQKKKTFASTDMGFGQWTFAVASGPSGEVRMPQVTEFLAKKKVKQPAGSNTIATRAGTLTDLVVRKFVNSPNIPYNTFIENMLQDEGFLLQFSKFSENTETPKVDINDPLLLRYAENYLKDMSYGLNYIAEQYKGYYITDLSSLIEDSKMPKEDKGRFFLYSAEVGIRGELDLIAISPDGKFRVIDIKTTDGNLAAINKEKYSRQTSIYDMLISLGTGLKSEGKHDIIYLTQSYTNPGTILGRKDATNRFKLSLIDYTRETHDNSDKDTIVKEIQEYNAMLSQIYTKEVTTSSNASGAVKAFDFNPLAMKRGRLKSIYRADESMSTYESLAAGRAWLLKTFPELTEAQVTILQQSNSTAGAEFFLDSIVLFERSNMGVAYHEGFHRFSQLFLTKGSREKMYQAARNKKIKFTTRDDRNLNTATAETIDIEEFLAEEFRKYAMAPEKYKFPKGDSPEVKNIFQYIWNALKAIWNHFRGNNFAFEDMFEQIYTGKFNRTNFSIKNAEFDHLNSYFIDSVNGRAEVLDNATFRIFRDYLDYHLSTYLTNNDLLITDLLSKSGLTEINKVTRLLLEDMRVNLAAKIDLLEEEMETEEDPTVKGKMRTSVVDLTFYKESVDKILQEDANKNLVVFPDFMRGFFKTSKIESLRIFVKKNREATDKLLDAESMSREEELEEKDPPNLDDNPPPDEIEHDRSGNEKQAMENARVALKDFFTGIPRRANSEIGDKTIEQNRYGLPNTLSNKEAFYKTLEITQGSMTLDNILIALQSPTNEIKFPEIVFIRERFLGNETNEGLIPKLNRISEELENGDTSNLDEHNRLISFLSHFTHVMSMRNIEFENFVVKLNYNKAEEGKIQTTTPLGSRKSLELIINNIIGKFTKGFRKNIDQDFIAEGKPKYQDVFKFMYSLYVDGKDFPDMQRQKYLYDPVGKTFFFNSYYAANLVQAISPTDSELKKFFRYVGINLNDKVYENSTDKSKLIDSYRSLRDIFYRMHEKSKDSAFRLQDNPNLKSKLIEWKNLTTRIAGLEEGVAERTSLEVRLSAVQNSIKGYVNSIFTSSPVTQMLFDSQDKKLRKDPNNRIFAINRLVFEEIARIEKKYHRRYSSGSMLVLDDLQFSYYLPNQMILIESLINNHVHSLQDFDKYPELAHLNPRINPHVMKSQIMLRLFNPITGEKYPGAKIGLSNIAQLSVINENDEVESKKMSQLRGEEKMLFDFLMVRAEGSGEIRRLETSNTAWRLSLILGEKKIKFLNITSDRGFRDITFLMAVHNYIELAAVKFQYHHTDRVGLKKDPRTGEVTNTLGIFDEMLPNSIAQIKDMLTDPDNPADPMTLIKTIETSNPDLFKKINDDIVKYFEETAITGKNSYKNRMKTALSQKSNSILEKLAEIQSERIFVSFGFDGGISDYQLRDFIANDFLMAMEDSALFFGDYTYFSDPAKRRKIIGNNGSINIVDKTLSRAIEAQRGVNSLSAIYKKNKSITTTKDSQFVDKMVIKDVEIDSKAVVPNADGTIPLVLEIMALRKQLYKKDFTYEEVAADKAITIKALSKMNIADGAAFISLDLFKTMMQREERWNQETDEKEYQRQQLILKQKLKEELTEDELSFVAGGPYAQFNVAKFAMTGPVYSDTNKGTFKPTFDKMGLRVLLPEVDWNRTTRPMFEHMLKNDVDYIVFESGSKGYTPERVSGFSADGRSSTFKGGEATRHAGGFFKNQQNTSVIHNDSTFSSQLRGIFFEIMLIQKQNGIISPALSKAYKEFIRTLTDYILVNSSRALSEMGLEPDGKIADKKVFINYLRERLQAVGSVDESLLDLLSTNHNNDFTNYLESLPFQGDIANLISGIVDDNFRKIRLHGSKMYQTPEVGTVVHKVSREEDLEEGQRGTIELKWHGLKKDSKGNYISTTPVEAKINFRKQFEPLLKLEHPDGRLIGIASDRSAQIRRLNEALRNPDWVRANYGSITFIGVRIPLQDINFSSHMIIKEFLPEVIGDTIILPPEFYMQTGSDNDIDSVTVTFKFLDRKTGLPVEKSDKSYNEINKRLKELMLMDRTGKYTVPPVMEDDAQIMEEVKRIRDMFIEDEIYFKEGKTLADLDDDLTIVYDEGWRTFKGYTRDSTLRKLYIKDRAQEQIDAINQLEQDMNETEREDKIDPDEIKKERRELIRARNNYIKGITNNIISSIYRFMSLPENYDFLTETDSLDQIRELAAKTKSMREGVEVAPEDLDFTGSYLDAISYLQNIVNHVNNTEIRTILGSVVKFRRILTTLAEMGTTLNPTYNASSLTNLVTGYDNRTSNDPAILKRIVGKIYQRVLYSPLLYKKDTEDGVNISIFDEDGTRTTKKLSMLASTLLDLFKNQNIFPNLGVTWLNVKPLVFMIAQGVPLERAILFINNPVVQEVQAELSRLGSDALDRHAVVSTAQNLFEKDMFLHDDSPGAKYADNVYNVKTDQKGRSVINKMMRRPGKRAQEYLSSVLKLDATTMKLSEKDLTQFTTAYAEYITDPEIKSYNKNLRRFLEKNPGYADFAKAITAYYATLLEDGDLFYKLFVKAINRDAVKHNSISSLSNAQSTKKARLATRMVNPEWEEKLEQETTQAPFYHDTLVKNILSNISPQLLNHPNTAFRERYIATIEKITSAVIGDVESRNRAEQKVHGDFIDLLYKNFYLIRDGKKGNTIYEWYQYDISPMLRPLAQGEVVFKDFIARFTAAKERSLTSDQKVENMYNDLLFSSQIDIFKLKYPELSVIKLLDELLVKGEPAVDAGKDTGFTAKDVFNMLDQKYVYLNLSSNADDRMAEETEVRDEWMRLYNFDVSQFPFLEHEIPENRRQIYQDPKNIAEIRKFAKNLAYYSLAQSSHLSVGLGSFSHLIPHPILKEVVETSIDNFTRFLSWIDPNPSVQKEAINKIMDQFETMFRDMNGDLNWQEIPREDSKRVSLNQESGAEEGETRTVKAEYKPYKKAHTGKLYSKIESAFLAGWKKHMLKEEGIRDSNTGKIVPLEEGSNDFLINNIAPKGDALNCSL